MHKTTERFHLAFDKLPESIKKISKKNFQLLKSNPNHPSLHFKKVGQFWSIRAGINYRALAVDDGDDFIWVWIGTHDDYERILKT